MTVEQIEQFIKEAIPDATVEIEDLKGCLLYTYQSPRDHQPARIPSYA